MGRALELYWAGRRASKLQGGGREGQEEWQRELQEENRQQQQGPARDVLEARRDELHFWTGEDGGRASVPHLSISLPHHGYTLMAASFVTGADYILQISNTAKVTDGC
jgi:hypothetical protein